MNSKQLLRKCLPRPLITSISKAMDKISLLTEPDADLDLQNLCAISIENLKDFFQSTAATNEWQKVYPEISSFGIPDGTGGVNPGDRRAIFYLVYGLKPRSVLEVGTHIGASTVHIAAALGALGFEDNPSLTSVDVVDVNDPDRGPWKTCGGKYSPGAMISQLQSNVHVEFIAKPALSYMASSVVKYDLIFLDGDHSAQAVYGEIPAALKLLNPGGVILLHDYFPKLEPLWHRSSVIAGPFLAVQRLRDKNKGLGVHPLGDLPWLTKRDSRTTSLAMLCRL